MKADVQIPINWCLTCLDREADLIMGQSPPSEFVNTNGQGIPFLQGNAEFGSIFPTAKNWCSQPQKKARAGDILVSVRAPVGALNKADQAYCIGRGLAAIRFTQTQADFGWYALQHGMNQMQRVAQGSTFDAINRHELGKLVFLRPTIAEQTKIATILASVDDAIERTQSLIAQLGRVKQAFLRHLVPGGRLPKGWRLTTLAEIADGKEGLQTGPFGSQLHAFEYAPEGIPVVMPKDIQNGQIMTATIARVPANVAARLERHRVKKNDILFARRGDIGRCGLVTEMEEGWLCGTGCLRARTTDDVNPEYLMQYLSLPDTVGWLVSNAVGQTMLNLNTSILGSLPILLPSRHEQDMIARSLRSIDQYGSAEFAYRDALDTTKRGLMGILLSGRKRVRLTQPVAATG